MGRYFVLGLLVLIATIGGACTDLKPIPSPNIPPPTSGLILESAAGRALPATPVPEPLDSPDLPATPTPEPEKHANILFILTDDLDADSVKFMPQVNSLLIEQGASFSHFFANVPFCCPSRASILRGQYAHNTQIYGNAPPLGGFGKFHSLGLENSTVATWLQRAGYRTALIGKYLNGYPEDVGGAYIPRGWDEWHSPVEGNAYSGFSYTLNENGSQIRYGDETESYGTDVYAERAIEFIQAAVMEGQPFFVYLATYTPHGGVGDGPAAPAPRHQNMFLEARVPRIPSFNEKDVSDKPERIQALPLLGEWWIGELDRRYRRRLQSLQAIDEMVGNLVSALKTAGQLENTYLVFTSDNGFHLGHHRLLPGKQTAYEEDIRVPLIVRGPNVPVGQVVDYLTGNIDLAPTFAEWAGAATPDFVDGRSLAPLLSDNLPSENTWRQAFLLQKYTAGKPSVVAPFQAIRTRDYLYVEYADGDVELYDLRNDQYQLKNIGATADPALIGRLSARLARLSSCAAAQCRRVENAPLLRQELASRSGMNLIAP